MLSKDITNILFLSFTLFIIAGCSSPAGKDSAIRIFFGANIQGKILPSEEKIAGVQGPLARVGGMLAKHMEKEPMPTVMVQLGNTIAIDSDAHLKKTALLIESSKIIGFKANLVSTSEFKDSAEFAKARAGHEWIRVLTNVKPKESIEPPSDFVQYYVDDPKAGRFVYFLNFISKRIFDSHPLLVDHYDWVRPESFIEEFIRKIRPRDLLIINYQTETPADLTNLFKVRESKRICLVSVNNKLYSKVKNRERRPEEFKDTNIISIPKNVSTIESVKIWWEPQEEKWKMEENLLQAGLSYPQNEEVAKILQEASGELIELNRREAFDRKINTLMPGDGEQRKLLDSAKCANCHESSYSIWTKSAHAKTDPVSGCDSCHMAGEPHVGFESWFKSLPASYHDLILEKYPDRLVGEHSPEQSCTECHNEDFEYDEKWLIIKHPVISSENESTTE